MLGRVIYDKQNIFLNDEKIVGVISAEAQLSLPKSKIVAAGFGYIGQVIEGEIPASFSISKYILDDESYISTLLGENILARFKYQSSNESTSRKWDNAISRITSYELSCEVGNLPTAQISMESIGAAGAGFSDGTLLNEQELKYKEMEMVMSIPSSTFSIPPSSPTYSINWSVPNFEIGDQGIISLNRTGKGGAITPPNYLVSVYSSSQKLGTIDMSTNGVKTLSFTISQTNSMTAPNIIRFEFPSSPFGNYWYSYIDGSVSKTMEATPSIVRPEDLVFESNGEFSTNRIQSLKYSFSIPYKKDSFIGSSMAQTFLLTEPIEISVNFEVELDGCGDDFNSTVFCSNNFTGTFIFNRCGELIKTFRITGAELEDVSMNSGIDGAATFSCSYKAYVNSIEELKELIS